MSMVALLLVYAPWVRAYPFGRRTWDPGDRTGVEIPGTARRVAALHQRGVDTGEIDQPHQIGELFDGVSPCAMTDSYGTATRSQVWTTASAIALVSGCSKHRAAASPANAVAAARPACDHGRDRLAVSAVPTDRPAVRRESAPPPAGRPPHWASPRSRPVGDPAAVRPPPPDHHCPRPAAAPRSSACSRLWRGCR